MRIRKSVCFALVAAVLALFFSFSSCQDRWKHLRSMSVVAKVETNLPSSPIATIIHLRDWHYVPFDQFTVDMEDAAKRKLSEIELAELWKDHLDVVENVQSDQMAVVRKLCPASLFGRPFIESDAGLYGED